MENEEVNEMVGGMPSSQMMHRNPGFQRSHLQDYGESHDLNFYTADSFDDNGRHYSQLDSGSVRDLPTIVGSCDVWTQVNWEADVGDQIYPGYDNNQHNWITDCDLDLALELISCCRGNGHLLPALTSSPERVTPPPTSSSSYPMGYTGPLPTLRLAPPDKDIEEIQLTIANQLRIQQSKQKLHFNKSWPSTDNPPGYMMDSVSTAGASNSQSSAHWLSQRPIGGQQQQLLTSATSCDHQLGSLLGDTRWRFHPPSPNSVSPSSGGGGSRGTSPLPPPIVARPTNPGREPGIENSNPPISLVVPSTSIDPRSGSR